MINLLKEKRELIWGMEYEKVSFWNDEITVT